MYKILIVEDDCAIALEIQKRATAWGLDVKSVEDFSAVLTEFGVFSPHLVLMDISLPFMNGYHWCNEIRKRSNVPIIFISSASDNMNIVMAMNMGGDDFIAKPFDMDVLISKILALLRRTYDYAESSPMLEHRGAVFSTADGSLLYNGEKLELTKNEGRILLCLLEQKGKTVSREKLMEKLWQTDSFVDDNTLTVNVNRLRKKLDSFGLDGFIMTKFGEGYLIP